MKNLYLEDKIYLSIITLLSFWELFLAIPNMGDNLKTKNADFLLTVLILVILAILISSVITTEYKKGYLTASLISVSLLNLFIPGVFFIPNIIMMIVIIKYYIYVYKKIRYDNYVIGQQLSDDDDYENDETEE